MRAFIYAVGAFVFLNASTQTALDESIRKTWDTWERDYGLRASQVPYDGVAMVEAMRRSRR